MSASLGQNLGFVHRFVPTVQPDQAVTLLLLHGTGGDENDLLPIGRQLLPSANLLGVRGKVLENGMPRFFRRLAEGVFDQEDLEFRTGELADFIGDAAQTYGFDSTRLFAVGYSNGANIAASLLLRSPEKLAGGILLHAMVPFTPESLPDLTGRPLFMGAGRNDPLVPTDNTERLAALFRQAGSAVNLYWHNGGHSLTSGEIEAAQRWLAQNVYQE